MKTKSPAAELSSSSQTGLHNSSSRMLLIARLRLDLISLHPPTPPPPPHPTTHPSTHAPHPPPFSRPSGGMCERACILQRFCASTFQISLKRRPTPPVQHVCASSQPLTLESSCFPPLSDHPIKTSSQAPSFHRPSPTNTLLTNAPSRKREMWPRLLNKSVHAHPAAPRLASNEGRCSWTPLQQNTGDFSTNRSLNIDTKRGSFELI